MINIIRVLRQGNYTSKARTTPWWRQLWQRTSNRRSLAMTTKIEAMGMAKIRNQWRCNRRQSSRLSVPIEANTQSRPHSRTARAMGSRNLFTRSTMVIQTPHHIKKAADWTRRSLQFIRKWKVECTLPNRRESTPRTVCKELEGHRWGSPLPQFRRLRCSA